MEDFAEIKIQFVNVNSKDKCGNYLPGINGTVTFVIQNPEKTSKLLRDTEFNPTFDPYPSYVQQTGRFFIDPFSREATLLPLLTDEKAETDKMNASIATSKLADDQDIQPPPNFTDTQQAKLFTQASNVSADNHPGKLIRNLSKLLSQTSMSNE